MNLSQIECGLVVFPNGALFNFEIGEPDLHLARAFKAAVGGLVVFLPVELSDGKNLHPRWMAISKAASTKDGRNNLATSVLGRPVYGTVVIFTGRENFNRNN